MTGQLWYILGTLVLALALFFPTRNIIWVLSVRRLERKSGAALMEKDRDAQLQRAGFIAALLVVTFSAMFNFVFFGVPKTGTVGL